MSKQLQLYVTIQLSVNTVLMSKNSSISNNSDKHKHASQMQVRFDCQKHFYFKLFSLLKQFSLP